MRIETILERYLVNQLRQGFHPNLYDAQSTMTCILENSEIKFLYY